MKCDLGPVRRLVIGSTLLWILAVRHPLRVGTRVAAVLPDFLMMAGKRLVWTCTTSPSSSAHHEGPRRRRRPWWRMQDESGRWLRLDQRVLEVAYQLHVFSSWLEDSDTLEKEDE